MELKKTEIPPAKENKKKPKIKLRYIMLIIVAFLTIAYFGLHYMLHSSSDDGGHTYINDDGSIEIIPTGGVGFKCPFCGELIL